MDRLDSLKHTSDMYDQLYAYSLHAANTATILRMYAHITPHNVCADHPSNSPYECSEHQLGVQVWEGDVPKEKLHNQLVELRWNIQVFFRLRPVIVEDGTGEHGIYKYGWGSTNYIHLHECNITSIIYLWKAHMHIILPRHASTEIVRTTLRWAPSMILQALKLSTQVVVSRLEEVNEVHSMWLYIVPLMCLYLEEHECINSL